MAYSPVGTHRHTSGNHVLWHVRQGVRDPDCVHCATPRVRAQHSYELPIRMPALVNDAGDPIAATELPCAVHPERWQADATAETRRQSARVCRVCPALHGCDQMRLALGSAARGVLAGVDCVPTHEATCQVCGAEFTASAYQGRYCGDLCRCTAQAARARAKRLISAVSASTST